MSTLKTQLVNSHWLTISPTMLSVGFVIAMNTLFEFEFVKLDSIQDLFYIKLGHDSFEINDFVQIPIEFICLVCNNQLSLMSILL